MEMSVNLKKVMDNVTKSKVSNSPPFISLVCLNDYDFMSIVSFST